MFTLKNWGKYFIAIGLGLAITVFMAVVFCSQSRYIKNFVDDINNLVTDRILVAHLKQLPPIGKQHIAIVAIDDKSIKKEGRWPWSRQKIGAMLHQLQNMGASVVAFDVIFSEPENNAIDTILKNIQDVSPAQKAWLDQFKTELDYDQSFSNIIAKGETILGYSFNPLNSSTHGVLPSPLLVSNSTSFKMIPEMQGYVASIDKLAKSSTSGGFLNAEPESRGVIRQSPLILRYGNKIYPSLSLAAVMEYLLTPSLHLVSEKYAHEYLLEGVELDKTFIPTDELGRILVPYREGAYAFSFYSATDIINHKVKNEDIAGRLIFVGVTATALGDIHPAPLSPTYPGVEVHASIASGIIDKYLPSRPIWSRGLEFILILVCGVVASLGFPFLNAFVLMGLMLAIGLLWYFVIGYMWTQHALMLSMLFPLINIWWIGLVNMVNSYVVANRQKQEIKDAFGLYVPKQHIANILKYSPDRLLRGDTKEITVLFSDIRGFTSQSEKLSAFSLKQQLNEYLTVMTQIIFDQDGTVDKYVGDMIMAFWNAPISNVDHAKKAVLTGMDMQKKLDPLNQLFQEKGLPCIKVGIGINTAICNIGDMGSKFRRNYTVIGDGVNLASRLEFLCRRYNVGVIVGENTFQATKKDFLYLQLDRVNVKGKLLAENIYLPIVVIEESNADLEGLVAAHHAALQSYFNQEWKKAIKQFKALAKTSLYVDLCQVFLERIDFFQQQPLSPNWSGAYEMNEK